jgi:hypothetical protein
MRPAVPLDELRQAFGVQGEPVRLAGGSVRVVRFGQVVCKPMHPGSLEHTDSYALTRWLGPLLHNLPASGFRLARPLPTSGGDWLSACHHWTAWTWLAGEPPQPRDIPACITAAEALHHALRPIPKHPLLERNQSIFGWADAACWDARPPDVHPLLAPLVDALYAVRRPVDGLHEQLIHGDLNRDNIAVAPGLPPGFFDLTPFWRPPEFALGMLANWLGPRRGDAGVLHAFEHVRAFEQMLVRAAIRMLLIMQRTPGTPAEFAASSEHQAAELVLDYLRGRR